MRKGMGEKKEQMIAALKLPMDVCLGELIISLIGRRVVYVENYRSILFFTDERLKIEGKSCKLNILGKGLTVEYYTEGEMKVNGLIERVELEG